MFKTMLSKACNAAERILLDGYGVGEELVVHDGRISVDAADQDLGSVEFVDQEIEVDEAGCCLVACLSGKMRAFEFSVSRGIVATDVVR